MGLIEDLKRLFKKADGDPIMAKRSAPWTSSEGSKTEITDMLKGTPFKKSVKKIIRVRRLEAFAVLTSSALAAIANLFYPQDSTLAGAFIAAVEKAKNGTPFLELKFPTKSVRREFLNSGFVSPFTVLEDLLKYPACEVISKMKSQYCTGKLEYVKPTLRMLGEWVVDNTIRSGEKNFVYTLLVIFDYNTDLVVQSFERGEISPSHLVDCLPTNIKVVDFLMGKYGVTESEAIAILTRLFLYFAENSKTPNKTTMQQLLGFVLSAFPETIPDNIKKYGSLYVKGDDVGPVKVGQLRYRGLTKTGIHRLSAPIISPGLMQESQAFESLKPALEEHSSLIGSVVKAYADSSSSEVTMKLDVIGIGIGSSGQPLSNLDKTKSSLKSADVRSMPGFLEYERLNTSDGGEVGITFIRESGGVISTKAPNFEKNISKLINPVGNKAKSIDSSFEPTAGCVYLSLEYEIVVINSRYAFDFERLTTLLNGVVFSLGVYSDRPERFKTDIPTYDVEFEVVQPKPEAAKIDAPPTIAGINKCLEEQQRIRFLPGVDMIVRNDNG